MNAREYYEEHLSDSGIPFEDLEFRKNGAIGDKEIIRVDNPIASVFVLITNAGMGEWRDYYEDEDEGWEEENRWELIA